MLKTTHRTLAGKALTLLAAFTLWTLCAWGNPSNDSTWFSSADHSFGATYYDNGDRYVGSYHLDKPNGIGVLYYSNGDRFIGAFLSGEPIPYAGKLEYADEWEEEAQDMRNYRIPAADIDRPTIGLTLGGGGLQCAAYIGVLRYIEEIGIPIDYIVSTGMGSVVGSLYAMGYSLDDITAIMAGRERASHLYSEVTIVEPVLIQPKPIVLPEIPKDTNVYIIHSRIEGLVPEGTRIQRGSRSAGRSYLMSMDFKSGERRSLAATAHRDIIYPRVPEQEEGYTPDNKPVVWTMSTLFDSLAASYPDEIDFDTLPIAFSCVATDVAAGKSMVLSRGKIAQVLRAAMARPGVSSPVQIGKSVLVDGGLSNNFPADICADMGSDIIIGAELPPSKDIDSANATSWTRLLNHLMSASVNAKTETSHELCNVYISPDRVDACHDNIDSLVAEGYRAARQAGSGLEAIKLVAACFPKNAPRRQSGPVPTVQMLHEAERQSKAIAKNQSLLRAADSVRTADSIAIVTKLMNSIRKRKSMVPAPHKLGIGLRFDSEENLAFLLGLDLNANNPHGWRYGIEGRLSGNPWARPYVSWTGPHNRLTLKVDYDFHAFTCDLLTATDTYEAVKNQNHRVRLMLERPGDHPLNIAAGLMEETHAFDQLIVDPACTQALGRSRTGLHNSTAGAFALMRYDNTNGDLYAKHGLLGSIVGEWRIDNTTGLTQDVDYSQQGFGAVMLTSRAYLSLAADKLTFIPQLYARTVAGDKHHFAYNNQAGGGVAGRYLRHQLPFIGINHPYATYDNAALLRCDMRYNPFGRHNLTLMANYLHAVHSLLPASGTDNPSEGYYGFGLEYAYNSIIGPLSADVHWSSLTNEPGFYISLGLLF